jgi:hypothetical protein
MFVRLIRSARKEQCVWYCSRKPARAITTWSTWTASRSRSANESRKPARTATRRNDNPHRLSEQEEVRMLSSYGRRAALRQFTN